jgi:hypothetical protein
MSNNMVGKIKAKSALVAAWNRRVLRAIAFALEEGYDLTFAGGQHSIPTTNQPWESLSGVLERKFALAVVAGNMENPSVHGVLRAAGVCMEGTIIFIAKPNGPTAGQSAADVAKLLLSEVSLHVPDDCKLCLMMTAPGLDEQTESSSLENIAEAVVLLAGSESTHYPLRSFVTFDPLDELTTTRNSRTIRWWDASTDRCLRTFKGSIGQMPSWYPFTSLGLNAVSIPA